MVEETFPDSERQLLVVWATRALVGLQYLNDLPDAMAECESILRKLTGTDTVLVARRSSVQPLCHNAP